MKNKFLHPWNWVGSLSLGLFIAGITYGQNVLQFTSVNATSENAIQLHWASNSNEVYEVDYADQLAGNEDGSTAWTKLYDNYPSHGTNTFVVDVGNYDIVPEIFHPKHLPMRFYRVLLTGANPKSRASMTYPVTFRVMGYESCIGDTLFQYSDPDPNTAYRIINATVFTPSP